MDHLGRRTIYILGGCLSCVILSTLGGLGFGSGKDISWATGSLLIVFALAYNCTIGSICYAIVSEVPSGRLRAKTIVLVAHGDILRRITASSAGPSNYQWRNAEVREYRFDPKYVDKQEAFLQAVSETAVAGGAATSVFPAGIPMKYS